MTATRRSGRAADDSPHRARQSRRAHRRHRLLRDAAARTKFAALPNVVRVVRNDDKPRLSFDSCCGPSSPDSDDARERFGDGDGSCGAAIEPGVAGRTAFTLRVQTGCAEPCSYCIIPTTRGRPRSVPVDDVLREVERVAAAGFKEIALTGVHLGSYGRDLDAAVVADRAAARARRRWP